MKPPQVSFDSSAAELVDASLPQRLAHRPWWIRAVSVAVLLGMWFFFSRLLSPLVLPGPWLTLQTLWQEIQEGEIFYHLGATMFRIFWSFVCAMVLGVTLGLAMGLSRQEYETRGVSGYGDATLGDGYDRKFHSSSRGTSAGDPLPVITA